MGLFDTIDVYMKCPYCGNYRLFEAQTKDLEERMYKYNALDSTWESSRIGKKFREKIRAYPRFPKDKSHKLWKNQAEEIEASATVPKKFTELKCIQVITSCNSIECQFNADRKDILNHGSTSGFGRSFEGKIRIKNGKLVGVIYDIRKARLTKNLSAYKRKHKKIFKRLFKKYKHEPIVCRNWNKGFKKT